MAMPLDSEVISPPLRHVPASAQDRLAFVLGQDALPAVQDLEEFLAVARPRPVQEDPLRRGHIAGGTPHVALRHQHLTGQLQQHFAHGARLQGAFVLQSGDHRSPGRRRIGTGSAKRPRNLARRGDGCVRCRLIGHGFLRAALADSLDRSAGVRHDALGQLVRGVPRPFQAAVGLAHLRGPGPGAGLEYESETGLVAALVAHVHRMHQLKTLQSEPQAGLLRGLADQAGAGAFQLAVTARKCQVRGVNVDSGCRRPRRTLPSSRSR